jgi:hypothetical protein
MKKKQIKKTMVKKGMLLVPVLVIIGLAAVAVISTIKARALEYIYPTTLPNGQVGAVYGPFVIANNVVAPITCTVEPSLPAGLSLDSDGLLSGTPQEAGNFGMTFSCKDGISINGQAASFNITIDPATVASSGKKVNDKGVVTKLGADLLTVDDKTVIYFSSDVKIKVKKKDPELKVGSKIQYKGVLNIDGSVTATEIKLK